MAPTYTRDERLYRLPTLAAEDLDALDVAITASFQVADEAGQTDLMRDTFTDLKAVRAQKAVVASADPAVTTTTTTEVPVPESSPAAEPDAAPAEPEETPSPDETADAPDGDADTTQEGTVGEIPEDRKPVPVQASGFRVVAGADIPGTPSGTEFQTKNDVAEAFIRRLDTVRRAQDGSGQQHVVATIVAAGVPEDRQLSPSDAEGNDRKIRAVMDAEPITAAGGWCAPLATSYDIFGAGVADRPVKEALVGFSATRGGLRFVTPPTIGSYSSAVGLWTAANDANPTDPTTKPCLTVACSAEQTALVDAVTLCLKFGNLQARAFPELVNRNNELAMIAHARLAEKTILAKLTAASTSVSSAYLLGTARDFLNAIGRAAAAYRARQRMDPNSPEVLRVIAPSWVRDAMREDIAMSIPGDNAMDVANEKINGWIRDRNVNVTWHLDDDRFGAEVAGTGLDDFPLTFDWWIFAEGTFLFLDGGTLDLGVIRDSTLVGTNDYKTFVETFEGVAKVGIESIKVNTTTHPAGHTSSTVVVA